MRTDLFPMTAVALVAALMVSVQQSQAAETFVGGTTVAANNAEGCCRGVRDNALFNFNGGVGSLLGISASDRQTLDGLDERNNPNTNGPWNPHPNNTTGNLEGSAALLSGPSQAVFTLAPAGGEFITGFQVMNATNAQFDERQSDHIRVEVSTDNGSSFQTVLDTDIDVVVTDGGGGGANFAPAPAQQFSILNAILADSVDFIRLTATENITSHNNVAPSLSEFRVVLEPAVPEPATAGLLAIGIGGFLMRRRRHAA